MPPFGRSFHLNLVKMADSAPTVPIDDLLAHAGWVRALALALLRDKSRADDVVQQTWLAALRTPPRDPLRVKGWLRRVVTNLVIQVHREESSRGAREAAVARAGASKSVPDVFARAEASRQLAEAVAALPPVYGEAILLRYFERLPPRVIAQRLGVPVVTVKSRLKRGLEALRCLLRERADREGLDWRMLLLPVLGAPTRPGRSATRLSRSAVVAAAAAAVVVAVCVIWSKIDSSNTMRSVGDASAIVDARSSGKSASRSPSSPRARSEFVNAATRDAPTPERERASDDAASDAASSPSLVPHHLPLQLTGFSDLVPADVALELRPIRARLVREATEPRVFQARGEHVSLDIGPMIQADPDLLGVEITVARADLVPTRVQVRLTRRGDRSEPPTKVEIIEAAIVEGDALDDNGLPLPGTLVGGFFIDDGVAQRIDTDTASKDGRFHLRLRPNDPHWIVLCAPGHRPLVVRSPPGGATAPPTHLSLGNALRGKVIGPAGDPITTGRVTLRAPRLATLISLGSRTYSTDGNDVVIVADSAPIEGDGTFAFGGLGDGKYVIVPTAMDLTGGLMNLLRQEVIVPGSPVTMQIEGGVVDVHVSGPSGPVSTIVGLESSGPTTALRTDAVGNLRLLGVPGEQVTLALAVAGMKRVVRTIEPPAVGQHISVQIDLEPATTATWEGSLEGVGALDVAMIGIALRPTTRDGSTSHADRFFDVPVAAGRFQVTDLTPGEYLATLRPGAGWADPRGFFAQIEQVLVVPDSGSLVSSVPLKGAGRFRLAVADGAGKPVAAMVRAFDVNGTEIPLAFAHRNAGVSSLLAGMTSAEGPADAFPTLLPGSYILEIRHRGAVVRRSISIAIGVVATIEVQVK